ncbi:hypothetical protein O6H91_17G007100 [Diphasiastrum complanatum]|uniref:Uncharacterized protein n=7 Tax=Diphasiastrum complanatum TaxID=34168 RepID=A0ACC2B3W7_DIPCM|nr:hypothetical protein O6H91_17G007100 [Diphasiastrum complanatum]KAJ7524468.1 hypothetical protein O6H91_17G007100 [Diphasiastrum complanatum]KAJ7524471.1 hypothetical protein O6H91_17G007100 [Diphasiastrum complanatum]KAJ7524472.1 hypothetical protein O6H91_17G007100 [Diphasiastrum complanatum]KAJ7524473.1 hypothetical protein O6H91_17G007100 [Diphasiastrum complanatum]
MADAKDILGLPKGGLPGGPLAAADKRSSRTLKEAPTKKPDGVSREVYALTGGVPPLMPTLEPSALKRRNVSQSKKVSWRWLPFTTSARTDNLQLYHWVRTEDGVAPLGDYAFAKYNKTVEIIRYTDEEYTKYLMDPNWTRQETDELFDLCEQFDLRFIIIADRIAPHRSVEELKNRYYSVAKTIVLARAATPEDVADHTLVKDTYNMQYEVERKRALGIMLSQSRQQEREDAEVLAEARRIMEARLITKVEDEAELAATLATSSAVMDEMEKISQTPAQASSPSSLPVTLPTSMSASMAMSGLVGIASNGPRTPRVYLRGACLAQMIHSTVTAAGARTIKRVDQALEELGVRVKPKVPTQTVCAQHMELRNEVLTLLNLQKQVQWKETEVSVLHDNPYADIPPPTPNTPKVSSSVNAMRH